MQQATITQSRIQATRTAPGHGTGAVAGTLEKSPTAGEATVIKLVFSVLANVIGGTLLLSGLLVLPHVIARVLS